jgi:hypothetical protein
MTSQLGCGMDIRFHVVVLNSKRTGNPKSLDAVTGVRLMFGLGRMRTLMAG